MNKTNKNDQIKNIITLGYQPESKLFIMGDCAFTNEGFVLFPDEEGIIWFKSIGYNINTPELKNLAHKSNPVFWSNNEIPQQNTHFNIEGYITLTNSIQSIANCFGKQQAYISIGLTLSYALFPELVLNNIPQTGLWISGKCGSGKTELAKQLMQIWGFPAEYATIEVNPTNISSILNKSLSNYSSIPCHFDEFREDEYNAEQLASIRNGVEKQSIQKFGHLHPLTIPIITGEQPTICHATKSGFLNIELSPIDRSTTTYEENSNYLKMQSNAKDLHKIGRHILIHRKLFCEKAMLFLEQWKQDKTVKLSIKSETEINHYGICYAVLKSALNLTKYYNHDELLSSIKHSLIDHCSTQNNS